MSPVNRVMANTFLRRERNLNSLAVIYHPRRDVTSSSALEREIAESLVLYVKRLNDESRNGALVVVEGRRDIEALRAIGFEGKVIMLCHNGSLRKLVQEAENHRKTILLLDLDRKGRSLTKKAAIILEGNKCVIDLYFRRELVSATRGRVNHVEELSRFKEYLQPYSKMLE
jgi:5S rRNA maturation endonuclease (ribonuclease M5)